MISHHSAIILRDDHFDFDLFERGRVPVKDTLVPIAAALGPNDAQANHSIERVYLLDADRCSNETLARLASRIARRQGGLVADVFLQLRRNGLPIRCSQVERAEMILDLPVPA